MEGVDGKNYQLILADPPWQYDRNRISQYETMPLKDILALPVAKIAAKDSVLCMWATFPKLKEALQTIEAWGFTYTTQLFTWIKTHPSGAPVKGLGHYTRGNAEVMLLGKRGRGLKRRRRNISSVLMSHRREHSRKPDEVRDLLVDLFGADTRRIELFSRSASGGWASHGKQKGKFSGPRRAATQARLTGYLRSNQD